MLAAIIGAALLANGATAATGPSRARPPCGHFAGIESVLAGAANKRFVIVGERHGTEQSPRLFGQLVCSASRSRPVNVFLELATSSTAVVQSFVSSDGSDQAKQALLRSDIWDRRYADGRSSEAIFSLLETLRILVRAGADIRVFSTQPDYLTAQPQFYDELARADGWARLAAARPDAVNLVLVGRAHAALRDNDDLGFLPAAAHLRAAEVLAIGPAEEGGAQWSLDVSPTGQPLMGVHPLPGRPRGRGGIGMLRDTASGWNAIYAFGAPARPSLPERR